MEWSVEGNLDAHVNASSGITLHLKDEGADEDAASFAIDYNSYATSLVTPSGERQQIFSIEELDKALLAEGLKPIAGEIRWKVGGMLRFIAEDRKEYA